VCARPYRLCFDGFAGFASCGSVCSGGAGAVRGAAATPSSAARSSTSRWCTRRCLLYALSLALRELNQAPAFWSLTFDAHLQVTLCRLGRLYDQQRRSLSLPGLIRLISANLHLFDKRPFRERLRDNPHVSDLAKHVRRPDEAMLIADAAAVSAKDPIVGRLLHLRNRVLAHRDPNVVIGIVKDPIEALTGADVETLLDRAGRLVNSYSSLYRAESSLMKIVGQEDFKTVLLDVRRHLEEREKQLEEALAKLQR
jgi:hypothetical protein